MDSKILGDYQIIKQIGQGALGTVFLAEQRFTKKHYMLKVLPEELSADRNFITRFQTEVVQLATLDHPRLVKMHNVSYAQGVYFLVNDCVVDELGETTNLAQYILAQKHLKEEEIHQILWQVAEGLDYMHSKRIAHKGLKLNNILVSQTKPDIQIHLCDFGLSNMVGEAAMLTRTYKVVAETLGISSLVFGTKGESEKYPSPPIDSNKWSPLQQSFLQAYAFLAPEQRRVVRNKTGDNKIDVFAFGVLAYYLLTRQLPEGYFELPSELGLGIKGNWDELIISCLRSNPDKRPENLSELLERSIKGNIPFLHPIETLTPVIERIIDATKVDPSDFTSISFSHSNLSEDGEARKGLHEPIITASFAHTATSNDPQPVLQASRLVRPEEDENPAAALLVDSAVKPYQPQKAEVRDVKPLLSDMVIIRGGEYMRGSTNGNRDEGPRHKITLSNYALDIHPVTNEQFVRFLEVMGGEKDHHHQDLIRLKDSRIKRAGGKLCIESGYSKHPVVGVTWYGAVAYARWVGKRLPTEAEWEIAARGGVEDSLYPTGEEIEKSQANFFSADTTPVMSYAPTSCGLYDVAGNVYEWCHDWYGYNYYEMSVQEPDNPRGPLQGVYRVLRGGCWKSLKEDLRCTRRHRNNPGAVNSTYGFRCAADVK